MSTEKTRTDLPRWGMVIDLEKCVGCHTCEIACKVQNDVPLGMWRSWVKEIEKGQYPVVVRSFRPTLCNHCANPVCVKVCPVKAAYQREDGIVMVDPHRCVGCRYCMAACPYEVRYIHPTKGMIDKCDFCYHRVDEGLQPACVEACPTSARVFGNLNDSHSEVAKLVASKPVQGLKVDIGTAPRVYYIGLDHATMEIKEEVRLVWEK
ncbi:MAG: 4Fe-4S dicluster domain-containing protein [Deltaproteobacteria bacterium]|nr:4Fe-4S dicluster domain-containing protein [Candidatus Anaeroferrophillus wilburensis]MBN2888339.1 4Fe-4S dicluster domain-containing protein [Deltaproteobacteria bacterium]